MEIGVLTAVFQDRSLAEALDDILGVGVRVVEIGCGNYPGNHHCNPELLLANKWERERFQGTLASRGMRISALACHGNPLHPDRSIAASHHQTFHQTVLLAEELGVNRLTLFSGCPGDSETSEQPNWVTCAWPTEYLRVLDWQWEEKVIPYWVEQAAFARSHGVTRLSFEMHPGFVVYNPPSLLRLREAVGEEVGANFDPSHLFWQGIDIVAAVRKLGPAIFHVHMKDTAFNPTIVSTNGVLDTVPLGRVAERAWIFRTVGFGHGQLLWRRFLSALREVGYDDVVSIEHEDALASPEEGIRKAVSFLQSSVLSEAPPEPWWTS